MPYKKELRAQAIQMSAMSLSRGSGSIGMTSLPPSSIGIGSSIKAGLVGVSMRMNAFFGGMGDMFRGKPWSFGGGDGSDPKLWKHDPENKKELATFGAGCYWGTEKFFATDFAAAYPGAILGTSVGFMNKDRDAPANPTYMQVCTRDTGYVEVAHVLFDSSKVEYKELVRFFYTFHDPTTFNRQGNDTGSQYASVIFAHSDKQREVANKVKKDVDTLI